MFWVVEETINQDIINGRISLHIRIDSMVYSWSCWWWWGLVLVNRVSEDASFRPIMKFVHEIYSYCTLVLLTGIVSVDGVLLFRFRTYYRLHGYGVVTGVLLNLVAVQLVGSLIFTTAAFLILINSNGLEEFNSYIIFFDNTGTFFVLSATLVHVIMLTCLRIYSISYKNRYMTFVSSSFNICLILVTGWFVSLAITLLTVISATEYMYLVFYAGVAVTGAFAIIAFFCTTVKYSNTDYFDISSRSQDQNIDGVQNQQKTFVVLAGVFTSFAVFMVPACLPNLYFNYMEEEVSLIVSLWCLLGVITNSIWNVFCLEHMLDWNNGWLLANNWSHVHILTSFEVMRVFMSIMEGIETRI